MRLILVVLFSLITVTTFSQKKKSDSNAPAVSAFSPELNSALKLATSEQYEIAGQAFDALLKKEPNNGDIYYYYGETVIKDYLSDTLSNSLKEMATKADELFRKGIQQDPSNVLNDVGLGGICLLRSSDTIAADKYFIKAEASLPVKQKLMTPAHAIILAKLGSAQLLGNINRYNKALNYLLRAKEIDPNNPSVYIELGNVYIRQNDATNALASYKMALYLDPKSPLSKIKIGNIYMRAPNLNAARPYFQEAREIDSTFAPVYRELGELYTKAGQYNLSKANFRKFLDLSGNNIPAKIQYAKALYRSRDYTTALETIEEILAVDKSRNYLNRLAAFCCYDKKPPELEKGRTYMETFFKNTDSESIILRDYLYYSRILFKSAKNDSLTLVKAFDAYKKAYAMDSNNVNASEIALSYYYSRWYKDAIIWLNIKNRKGKSDKDDLMKIGRSYYQIADFHSADSVFSKIITEQPDNMQAYVWQARIASSMDPSSELGFSYLGPYFMQKKDYPAAKLLYKNLFSLDPSNKQWQIQSLQQQASIAYDEKKYAESRDFWIEIKKLDPNFPNVDKIIRDFNKAIEAAAAAAAAKKK
ncbi:MAG: tetratricopeptide repeat protein [Bacteroidia bacterium]|nr:tetratricopeptide repeat protein [Bacteroidia bacterium]